MMTELNAHYVYTGLSRPATMLGVNADYFTVSVLGCICAFILCNSIMPLFLLLPLHLLGWILTQMDPFIFAIIGKRFLCLPGRNKYIWGCNSYAP